jgi:hypothetical protein
MGHLPEKTLGNLKTDELHKIASAEWKRGEPPCDPRVELDWADRWEIYHSVGGIIWHRFKINFQPTKQ